MRGKPSEKRITSRQFPAHRRPRYRGHIRRETKDYFRVVRGSVGAATEGDQDSQDRPAEPCNPTTLTACAWPAGKGLCEQANNGVADRWDSGHIGTARRKLRQDVTGPSEGPRQLIQVVVGTLSWSFWPSAAFGVDVTAFPTSRQSSDVVSMCKLVGPRGEEKLRSPSRLRGATKTSR